MTATLLRSALITLLALVPLSNCATAQMQLTAEQTTRVQRQLVGEPRFTRVAFHVTPFFGDATRRFLSPTDPRSVELVMNPNGTAIVPGPIEQTIEPGVKARITAIDFPSGFNMADRVLVTPRTLIWLTVELEGQPKNALPLTLVLRPGLRDDAEMLAEVDRLLSKNSPAELMKDFSDTVKAAVKAKKAVAEMPAAALEMAWGYPSRKSVSLEGDARLETWVWGDGKSRATLKNGVVTTFTEPK